MHLEPAAIALGTGIGGPQDGTALAHVTPGPHLEDVWERVVAKLTPARRPQRNGSKRLVSLGDSNPRLPA